MVSINAIIEDEKRTELEDFIVSTDDTPEDIATKENMQQDVKNLLISCNLKPRERDILILRYGLDGKEPMTLVEIGKIYNLTRERVRAFINGDEPNILLDFNVDGNVWELM